MLRMLILISLLLPATAIAQVWHVDAAKSTLTFKGSYQGDAFTGTFRKFDAKIAYDPADLGSAKFDVNVELASADTASAERDETLKGSDFFATDKFPNAHFLSQSFVKAADGSVAANGTLTIRDIARPVTLKVVFVENGNSATLDVDTSLKRADFGLGTSSDWAEIAADVAVHGHLILNRK